MVQLHRDTDNFTKAGAALYVIGNGTPNFIAGFREQTLYDGPIYTDPTLAVYSAAQLKRSVASAINPRGLLGAARAFASGHRQGRTQGDNWQQGGVLVIGVDGRVLWHHASEWPGDNAKAERILAAL